MQSADVTAAFVYSFGLVEIFAAVYALLGYKKHFVTTPENEDKNVENSIVASVMLQSNAMGSVSPRTSLGTWISAAQTVSRWAWQLLFVSIITNLE
jgi:hypothetical protein